MDFFEGQDRARRGTKWLIGYFVVAVLLIIAAVYAAVSLVLAGVVSEDGTHRRSSSWVDVTRFSWVSLGTVLVVAGGCLVKMSELRSGGSAVASMLGGRLVPSNTTHPEERRLLNIVEEMAIASGVPVPVVYLLAEEEGINAFAAGYKPGDAVIGVTRGTLRYLTRDELQGVIAHEFSHILNGDMRLNVRLIGWIFGIMGLAIVGRVLLQVRGTGRDRNPLPLIGLALIVIGWAGSVCGRLIQSAVCRQREYLADAAAVQFTRNPSALAAALRKIGGLGAGSAMRSPNASQVSHLLFANGMRQWFASPFATHPPLERRIRAIDPSWDGTMAAVKLPVAEAEKATPPERSGRQQRPPVILSGGIGSLSALANVGQPEPRHVTYAADWRLSLPKDLDEAAHDPVGAQGILVGMLLSRDPLMFARQLDAVRRGGGEAVVAETERLLERVRQATCKWKLPLVDLAMPALHVLSEAQCRRLEEMLDAVVRMDDQIDLFEYALQGVIRRHIQARFGGERRMTQYYALTPLLEECATVLSLLASVGSDSTEQADRAFATGWEGLATNADFPPGAVISRRDLAHFDAALGRLAELAPNLKKRVLHAAACTISADGVIGEPEAELLRAIADTLDCPIPPFVRTV